MTKEELNAKHIELFEAVKADPSEKNCDDFGFFDAAGNEKKIELMDKVAQKRSYDAERACKVCWLMCTNSEIMSHRA
ncbi:hypothetical protein [Vibrio parahaemolyticus]|uniref:hypothetical protein n=1 Tax=Vibrio parahaemolyticus TaxID=670 RepID=UPI000411B9FD|nr:hypothetical protein [Vibrio parahaemolyticus]ANB97512.1 hypothetical protein FORC14_1129 [Vibrio parahaemolyticus]EGQ9271072.1 hypothetical protein [Vibrio parahaemolyticus]EGQ9712428.1 hypothetical protein [Vibrio parahaemolyticus]EGQ9799410.1 hypothetical protein [Vibrio parahaemolyticus]EGR1752985.1 hypothetical protein [Vibrio parahaemolyticus]